MVFFFWYCNSWLSEVFLHVSYMQSSWLAWYDMNRRTCLEGGKEAKCATLCSNWNFWSHFFHLTLLIFLVFFYHVVLGWYITFWSKLKILEISQQSSNIFFLLPLLRRNNIVISTECMYFKLIPNNTFLSALLHPTKHTLFFAETLSTKMRCLTYKEQKLPELEF